MTGAREQWEIDADSPLALALQRAIAAAEAGRRAELDAAFAAAVEFAGPVDLAAAIAARHVDALRTCRDGRAALDRCADYRVRFPASVRLALLRAETRAALGDPSRLGADLAEAGQLTGPREAEDDAREMRLVGLFALHRREFQRARTLLTEARQRYGELGNAAAVAAVDDDLRRLAGRLEPPPEPPEQDAGSTSSTLARAEMLRLAGRYEQALDVVQDLTEDRLDPALVYPVAEARVRLLRILHRHDEADALLPELYRAAESSVSPERNRIAAARLERHPGASPGEVAADRRLQQVRALVAENRLAEAETLLCAEAQPSEPDRGHEAEWHLAAGELTLAVARNGGGPAALDETATHLRTAKEVANQVRLFPIVVAALRLLGRVHELRGDLPAAVRAWAAAHQEEERIASLQRSDAVRVGYLVGVPDEYDEQVRVAADGIAADRRQVAAVAVAIEAARGAALLGQVLPAGLATVRELPAPGDVRAALVWMRRARRGLPLRQVIWMLHATTDAVHHVLVGRWFLQHVRCEVDRTELHRRIEAVRVCYTAGGQQLHDLREQFAARLGDVAELLRVDQIVGRLPRGVRRIAVVAGAELSDLPFAALPCAAVGDAGRDLLGSRFALSDLPCLSVRRPLRRRSARQRGLRGLLVQPHPRGIGEVAGVQLLTKASELADHTVLTGAEATPGGVGAAFGSDAGFGTARLDCHGRFGDDTNSSVLSLWAADGRTGQLTTDEFAALDLGRTGTVMLGACESGMHFRRGRDERIGFVRAGLTGGAAAVLAPRWQPADTTAATVLDTFEDGLCRYPRDVALQRAIKASGADPVDWAAWTLHGDPGFQTRCGPLRRVFARRRVRGGPTSEGGAA